jgi:hypothetical protein
LELICFTSTGIKISTVKRGQTLANIAMSFIPFALPGAVPAAINQAGTIADTVTFKADGTPKYPL